MPKINAATIDEHKEKTRTALLEAGAASFVELGLAGTSIGVLADEAGIARTTVYEYFPNKEAVLADLIYGRLPRIAERVVADLPENPIDRLVEMVRRSLLFVDEYPVETVLLFKVSRELPKPERDAVWSVLHPIREEIMLLCAEVVAGGRLHGVDPISLGIMIGDLVVGGIDELAERGRENAAAVIAARTGFLRSGLGAGT
ncbi:MAG: TetR/AcrR family transcriptional regulator [Acidimicrobiia bacterium]